ncbi:MAG: hypothetical protein ABIL49_03660 [candidate division WOR-3 bacterium]
MRKKLLIGTILILLGIFAGMSISSNLNIFNKAVAQTPQVTEKEPKPLLEIQDAFTQIAEYAIPSVVNISTTSSIRTRRRSGEFEEFFRRFFGEPFPFEFPEIPRSSLGSGFIFKKEGNKYFHLLNHNKKH